MHYIVHLYGAYTHTVLRSSTAGQLTRRTQNAPKLLAGPHWGISQLSRKLLANGQGR